MRSLCLEMLHHFGSVLESHHNLLPHHLAFSDYHHTETRRDPLEEARNEYLHYHGLKILHAHHHRLIRLHRRMIALSHSSDFRPFIDAHHELLHLHRAILRLCDQSMPLLQKDFGVNAEHRHLLEPSELRPAEDSPEPSPLI